MHDTNRRLASSNVLLGSAGDRAHCGTDMKVHRGLQAGFGQYVRDDDQPYGGVGGNVVGEKAAG